MEGYPKGLVLLSLWSATTEIPILYYVDITTCLTDTTKTEPQSNGTVVNEVL